MKSNQIIMGYLGGASARPDRTRDRIMTESVIGDDDGRSKVRDTTVLPYRMICRLAIETPSGQTIPGTGWLAGPRTVVTAGHCISSISMGGMAISITIEPGRRGPDTLPFGSFEAGQDKFRLYPGWEDTEQPDKDLGCIQLAEPIGSDLGWFATAAFNDSRLQDAELTIAGYPRIDDQHLTAYKHTETILAVREKRLYYGVDTSGGQSGSPGFIYDGQMPAVVLTHAKGAPRTPDEVEQEIGGQANSGQRITQDVLDQVRQWLDEA